MKNKTSSFRLSLTHIKILETIANLNSKHAFPTAEGVGKILNGINDQETKSFIKTSTFAILLSYRGRKLTALVTNLYRHGYLTYIFEDGSNAKYLKITSAGESALLTKKDHLTKPYKRKEKKCSPSILFK